VLVTVAFIIVFRWIVMPTRVRAGTYSVWSFSICANGRFRSRRITLETLSSLFATLYMRSWYRLMGARIGKDSEISTNLSAATTSSRSREMLHRDEVVLGRGVRRGWMYLKAVKTGDRVFVGNDASCRRARKSHWRADRHQVEAAANSALSKAYMVRFAADQAARAAEIRRWRLRLDL